MGITTLDISVVSLQLDREEILMKPSKMKMVLGLGKWNLLKG